MYDLPVNALKVFAAVYAAGGVRPAARMLRVAHSSVSRHLAELEKWIGVELQEKHHGGRSLVLTPQGKALGSAVVKSYKELNEVVKSVRESPGRNTVTLSTTPSVASMWLLPRLAAFRAAYPWIELSVLVEQKLVSPSDQSADIAIRMGKGPWKGLDCSPLMDDQLFPVMSRSLWEELGRPSDPTELKHLLLLHDRDPNSPWDLWLAKYCPVNIDTASGPRFTSSDLVLRGAEQGLGVALARGRLAAESLAIGTLVKPFDDRQVRLPDAYWIVKDIGTERAPVRAVGRWLRDQALIPIAPAILPPPK